MSSRARLGQTLSFPIRGAASLSRPLCLLETGLCVLNCNSFPHRKRPCASFNCQDYCSLSLKSLTEVSGL